MGGNTYKQTLADLSIWIGLYLFFVQFKAMFTLYRIGFCSVSKVVPVQCERELMFCCGAEIVPNRSQCEQKPYPSYNLQTLPFDLKRSFTKTRFLCNFYSDKSVQTWFGPFQKPIRYNSGAEQYTVPEQKLLRKQLSWPKLEGHFSRLFLVALKAPSALFMFKLQSFSHTCIGEKFD